MVIKLAAICFLFIMTVMSLLTWLHLIGGVNEFLNPKKFKKIDATRKKIFIPYHGGHFWGGIKGHNPYFEGTVFRVTYILTIVSYVYFLLSSIFWVILAFFWGRLLCLLFMGWVSLFDIVIAIVYTQVESAFAKRSREEGPDFKL